MFLSDYFYKDNTFFGLTKKIFNFFKLFIFKNKIMAKARKEGKKGKSRKSVLKTLRMIKRNEELIKKYTSK